MFLLPAGSRPIFVTCRVQTEEQNNGVFFAMLFFFFKLSFRKIRKMSLRHLTHGTTTILTTFHHISSHFLIPRTDSSLICKVPHSD